MHSGASPDSGRTRRASIAPGATGEIQGGGRWRTRLGTRFLVTAWGQEGEQGTNDQKMRGPPFACPAFYIMMSNVLIVPCASCARR